MFNVFCSLAFPFVLFSFCAVGTTTTTDARKNVLFIIVDDLRPALGCYGDFDAVTPNIDLFAGKSVVFQRAYAQQALCAPSRNSMLTSRRPDTLRLYDFYSYWRRRVGNFTTLPQYFREHGYHTHSIGKVFHPGTSSGGDDDFPYSWSNRTFHASTERYMNEPVCFDRHTKTLQQNLICPVTVKLQPEQSLPDIQSVVEAKRLLQTVAKPFFVAVGIHKPHIPFRFPAKYTRYHRLDKFETNNFDFVPYDLPTVAFNPYSDIRKRDDSQRANISFPFGPMPKHFAYRIRQSYYSAVTYVDALIGDLLKSVDFSSTIVVLTSDHGFSLGEHAEWAKYSNYEIAVRVPLIIYSPDFRAKNSRHIKDLVELVDIFPTIVDLAALSGIHTCSKSRFKQSTCTEGKSLFPHFSTAAKRFNGDDIAISQYPRPTTYPSIYPDSDRPRLKNIKIMGYSLRTAQFRYTIWLQFNPRTFKRNWHRFYGEELYDHSIDPNELINLHDRNEYQDLKLKLKKVLRDRIQ